MLREPIIREIGAEGRLAITADGAHKTMTTVLKICRWLLEKGAGRDARLIALGGGTTSDIVGFAAGIYKRGISYSNIPTTLLALADASTGGKTGVNLDSYKNILGVFKAPSAIILSEAPLRTLPAREVLSGSAEILKSFIISGEGYEDAVRAIRNVHEGKAGAETLMPYALKAAEIKAGIVKKDPYEKGLRKILNLGHTWGHAIEWWEGAHGIDSPLSHGEAVAIGIIRAARLSEKCGLCGSDLVEKLRSDFQACGLPTETGIPEAELLAAVRKDKKTDSNGRISWVLVKGIGNVIHSTEVKL